MLIESESIELNFKDLAAGSINLRNSKVVIG